MSEIIQIEPLPNVVVRIAELDAGAFWCKGGILGIPDEDSAAYLAGRLSKERIDEIKGILRIAITGLRDAPCGGVSWWMSTRRAIS